MSKIWFVKGKIEMCNVLVSVLIAVYNTPIAYLKEAIEGILLQTYTNIEIILINDHSTDSEVNMYINKIAQEDNRIKLVNNEKNVGLTKSLNIGLLLCSGKYIARIDSDDVLLINRIEEQVRYMELHPEVSVLGAGVENIGTSSWNNKKHIDYTADREIFRIKMLFKNAGPVHSAAMLRKSFLDEYKIKYRDEMKKSQDYALWVDAIKAGGVFSECSEKLVKYRLHENQISERNYEEQQECKKAIITEQLIYYFGDVFEKKFMDVYTSLYLKQYYIEPYIHIEALKYIIRINRKKKVFDIVKFEDEIKQRWIHKVMKCMIKNKDFRGLFHLYTWKCFMSKSLIGWIKEMN